MPSFGFQLTPEHLLPYRALPCFFCLAYASAVRLPFLRQLPIFLTGFKLSHWAAFEHRTQGHIFLEHLVKPSLVS